MARFKPRELREGLALDELRRELNAIQKDIRADLDAAANVSPVTSLQTTDYTAKYGDVVRVAPPSGGLRLILPPVNLAQPNGFVTVVVEAATGALTAEAVDTTVNGATTLVLLAGIGTVEFRLTPTGWYAWSASLQTLPLTSLAAQAADSFVGNITAASAVPVAVPLASVDSTSVPYDATAHEFRRAALTGAITAAANVNATLFDTGASGAGLTGGGTAILAVGAGTGITVNANDVAVSVSALRGVGLTVAGSTLEPRRRPRRVQLVDYFAGGTATSGSIGELGWSLLGTGTPVYARTDTSLASTQKNSLTTSAGTNDRSVLALGETEARDVVTATTVTLVQTMARLPSLTSVRYFFGMMGTLATEPSVAVDCLGIYYDSAVSANWQLIARASSVGSPVVSSSAVPADTGELLTMHQSPAGTFSFYTGNILLGAISSGVPTAGMNLGARLETLTTAAKTARQSHFHLEAVVTGAYSADTFLEA